jgi:hypothetical protein
MKLRRSVTIHRAGSIVFKLRDDEFAGRLGGMIASDPRLRIMFQLIKSDTNAFSVCFPDSMVGTYKSSDGNGLRG